MKISINLHAAVFTLHAYTKTASGTTYTQHWNCSKDYIRTYTHRSSWICTPWNSPAMWYPRL